MEKKSFLVTAPVRADNKTYSVDDPVKLEVDENGAPVRAVFQGRVKPFKGLIGGEGAGSEEIRAAARTEAEAILEEAHKTSESLIDQANQDADLIRHESKKDAQAVLDDAEVKAKAIIDKASEEAKKILDDAKSSGNKNRN